MNKPLLLVIILFILILFLPLVGAVIEEDWDNYTKEGYSGESKTITFSWLKKSYTIGDYTITAKDFDAQGFVVMEVEYRGTKEIIIFMGQWDASGSQISLSEPVELFNKSIKITPTKIVPPTGIFTCCPEATFKIESVGGPLLDISIETEDVTSSSNTYKIVDPFANWSYNAYNDSTRVTIKNRNQDSFRMYEEIPIEINVTNTGESETTNTVVYIDSDGLEFKKGSPYYNLFTLVGEDQVKYSGISSRTIKQRLKIIPSSKKLKYTVHAYVKGVHGDTTYYDEATREITLLPSVSLRKHVTGESLLLSREEVELLYPSSSYPGNEIFRWLQSPDIFVTIGVTNHQNYKIRNLTLGDTVPDQFSTENFSKEWNFDLGPFETKEFKYKLITHIPGNFKLPAANVSYSEFNLSWKLLSETLTTDVHGPCVEVFKKTDKPVLGKQENATITIIVRNTGDMPSKITVIDSLPENATYLDGDMYYDDILVPMDSAEISYNISLKTEGQIQLPNPKIYVNGKENPGCKETISGKILITETPVPTPETPVPTSEKPSNTPVKEETSAKNLETMTTPAEPPIPLAEKYYWLEGAIPILMIVLAAIVILILNRSV